MKQRGRTLVMTLAMLAWLGQPTGDARADWPLSFALITCSPELGVFRLATLQGNEPTVGDPRVRGALTADDLVAHESVCELPNYRIVVEGRNVVTGRGPCGAVRGQQARVRVNQAPVVAQLTERDEGWIELTACNGSFTVVEVHVEASDGSWSHVQVCQVSGVHTGARVAETTGRCRTWQRGDEDFPFAAP